MTSCTHIVLYNYWPLQTIADVIRTCLGPKAMLKVSHWYIGAYIEYV